VRVYHHAAASLVSAAAAKRAAYSPPVRPPAGPRTGTVRHGGARPGWLGGGGTDAQLCHRGIYDAYLLVLARTWHQQLQQQVQSVSVAGARQLVGPSAPAAQYFDRQGRPLVTATRRPSDRLSYLSQRALYERSLARSQYRSLPPKYVETKILLTVSTSDVD